jgi:hypothetical protein
MLPSNGPPTTIVKYTTLLGASTSCHLLVIQNRIALNRAAELTDPHPNGMYPSHFSYVFATRFHICKTYLFWRTEWKKKHTILSGKYPSYRLMKKEQFYSFLFIK